ncbi:hypothetical protein CBR59_10690 [Bacillus thuringiensis]|uniref:hypothetical protein n=1 Tax=Bacillus thuringiensis TaxID=1428 RepID=UPI000C9E7F66|nr:hypothetical protein [Bacillus thuringiensis]PNK28608.1 hypothetical protein CBP87_16080 [Bacillus thuringiensis]PNK56711.1 hypothetical protein CBR59_10690 [Bacillus thuringiensis]
MLKKWFKNYLGESHCKHKYIFIKMQDNENFKKGTLGVVYIYQCEKCKNNNEINNEFLDI